METIAIQAENEEELKLVQSFLKQHKLKGCVLTDEDKVDIILSKLMEETDYNDTIDTEAFVKQLRS